MNDAKETNKLGIYHTYNENKFCLFLDPPWGGAFYKTEDKPISLFLGDKNIIEFIFFIY